MISIIAFQQKIQISVRSHAECSESNEFIIKVFTRVCKFICTESLDLQAFYWNVIVWHKYSGEQYKLNMYSRVIHSLERCDNVSQLARRSRSLITCCIR